mmetsp:Transcript_68453/g.158810  ORF Transcript_68453/g.158810 Transcript_68453/m.158810 type:complete len:210 (+) Transcript_68453:441-1070(+)
MGLLRVSEVTQPLGRPDRRQDLGVGQIDLARVPGKLELALCCVGIGGEHGEILPALLKLQHQEQSVCDLVSQALVATEVGAAASAPHLEGVVDLALLLAYRQPAPHADPSRAVEKKGAEALCGSTVAGWVEDELYAFNSGSTEDRAADVLPVGKVLWQPRRVFEEPLYALDHARLHPLHLPADLRQHPVVCVAVADERAFKQACHPGTL